MLGNLKLWYNKNNRITGERYMGELTRINKEISLRTLESILKDDTIFRKFIMNFDKEKDLFKEIDQLDYIYSLNTLMDYYIKHDDALSKKYFEKMNYINSYYKGNLKDDFREYSYEEYLNQSKPKIPFKVINSILADEEVFHKFLHFNEFREYFKELPLDEYIQSILDMQNFYQENHLSLQRHKEDRIKTIKSQFIFETPHNEILTGERYEVKIDPTLEKEVLKKVNLHEDTFVVARSIYMELCKLVTIDDSFLAQPKKIEEQNRTIAKEKSFAAIYATLLRRVGIDAVVSSGKEKSALFLYKGLVVKANATEKGTQIGENYYVSDITRVKIGLKTVGFKALNPENDIHAAVLNADKKQEEYQKKVEEHRKDLEEKYRFLKKMSPNKEQNLVEVMEELSKFDASHQLSSLDYTEYIRTMIEVSVADTRKKEVSCVTCYKKYEGKHRSVLIVDLTGCHAYGDTYYLFEEQKGGIALSNLDLRNMKKMGILSIPSEKFEKNLEDKKGWNY
jgi:uncharacterized cupredoxin-like copper-binding protein